MEAVHAKTVEHVVVVVNFDHVVFAPSPHDGVRRTGYGDGGGRAAVPARDDILFILARSQRNRITRLGRIEPPLDGLEGRLG
mgnify:CR=1 FL=1